MSSPGPATAPVPVPASITYGRIAAQVSVTDIARALDFYVGVLGFQKVFENGQPVGFVILERQGAELHLSLDRRHKATTQNQAHLMVDNANALHDHLVAHGARIIKGLRDADYRMRGFVFCDPDGNRIDVGQDL